ncbi:MAG: hypothetical protein JNJ83_14390 [Verrucomicrobiaceae bacterium]|nr:hypothetical protein [Verrucomicrobiaceae bacterium]
MDSPELFLLFTRRLNEVGVHYMVTGSVAAIYYGEPRMTNDVDIVMFLKREDARRLVEAFPTDDFYCPPVEVIEGERARDQRGHFNLIHHDTGFKADIYLTGRDDLHSWGMANAKPAMVESEVVTFAPPEYVIVRKLQFYREGGSEKHLRDISRMLIGLGEEWPRETLERLIGEWHLNAEWQEVLSYRF